MEWAARSSIKIGEGRPMNHRRGRFREGHQVSGEEPRMGILLHSMRRDLHSKKKDGGLSGGMGRMKRRRHCEATAELCVRSRTSNRYVQCGMRIRLEARDSVRTRGPGKVRGEIVGPSRWFARDSNPNKGKSGAPSQWPCSFSTCYSSIPSFQPAAAPLGPANML